MVRSVATAADRQTRVVACVQRSRKWPQPEEQYEEDGESASHLTNMLHEVGDDVCVCVPVKGRCSGIIDASRILNQSQKGLGFGERDPLSVAEEPRLA
jgi:hypothetical protein